MESFILYHGRKLDYFIQGEVGQSLRLAVTLYFQFIVPKGKEEEMRKMFPKHNPKERSSKNGNYTSFTIQMMMPSTDSVIEVYLEASAIDGIIAL